MSTALPGPGFLLQVADATGGSGHYTTIHEVKEIKALPLSVDIFDVTNQSSPGGYEEVVPTIRRSGETSFDVNFDPNDATHDSITGLQFLLNSKTKRGYQLLLPSPYSGNVPQWFGFVVGFDITAPVAGVLMAACKIKVTGQPTWGAAF
jgi:hypothetical protein